MDEQKIKQEQVLKFQREIEQLKSGGLTTLEAIAHFCEERDMDVEEAIPFISPKMLSELLQEAKKMNLVNKEYFTSLPLGD